MSSSEPMLRQLNTWMHFIGGHYASPEHFLREAQRIGVSRRVPAQLARAMNFGERVICLRYGGPGKVLAFAEFRIDQIIIEGDITDAVGQQLAAQGRARYESGTSVLNERECGFYLITGTWHVAEDVSLQEVLDKVIEIGKARGQTITCLVGGPLTQVYDAPALLPGVKFTRGFIKQPLEASFEFTGAPVVADKQVVTISNYTQKGSRV